MDDYTSELLLLSLYHELVVYTLIVLFIKHVLKINHVQCHVYTAVNKLHVCKSI